MQPARSPRIVNVEWGRLEVEGVGELKDAKLFPGGGRAWDWAETREAVRIYNELAEHTAVGGLFHSTC